jgi:CubicO group peptidase (beta-lactamase class C family)
VDGDIVFEKGFGTKHRDRVDPVLEDTQFRIGSSTKMMTAAGIMRLVDEGLVDLGAPVTRYVPEFEMAVPGEADTVTVRSLLDHTSSFPDNSAMSEDDLYGPTDPGALGRWVSRQGETRLHAYPGAFWNYSSANYMIAGRVIENVSGLSYQDYMSERVFEPAGMLDSTLKASEVIARGNFAYGHWWDYFHPGVLRIWRPDEQDNWARHPTGYVHSTVGDLIRWTSMLMEGGGGVLTPESAELLQSPLVHRDLRPDQYYGLGVFSELRESIRLKHHAGSSWGWSASVDWVPDSRFAVVTLSNHGGAPRACALQVLDALLEPEPVEPPACPQERDRWPDYVGHYEGRDNQGRRMGFDIALSGGRLSLRIEYASGTVIETEMAQSCASARQSGSGTFTVDTDGDGQSDQEITMIRDRVDQEVWWIRNRFFVGRTMEEPTRPTATSTATVSIPTAERPTSTPSVTPVAGGTLYLPRADVPRSTGPR